MTSDILGRTAAPAEPASPGFMHRPRRHQRFELGDAAPSRPDDHIGVPDGDAGKDPAWTKFALIALLLGTAVLYLWDLSASGYANSFYAAAAQSASASWKAWFFGSLDLSNFITVDKPPASLWVMGLSGRIFGFSSWSLLVPQALEGVAAVWLLFLAVRRWSGATAGLVAGLALALTPAAALMFRFDNPDALLTLLLVAGAYCMVRALEKAGTRWLLLAGTAIGFAFLTKMMQGFLVLPAFALVYLIAAPTSFGRRLWQSVLALVAVLVSAGWWIAAVELWPASSRPYVGGSTNNSVLDLIFGYNGFGRLLGGSGNGGGGGGGGAAGSSFGGATGLTRLFSSEMGNEISWLIPAALVALVAGLIVTRKAPRTDRTRAALILWGGWFIVTALTFSYMKGTIHPYYTVALAPAIAALVAVGGRALWLQRSSIVARIGLSAMVLASGFWSFELLARNADWFPVLRYAVLAVSIVVGFGLMFAGHLDREQTGGRRRVRRSVVALMVAAVLTAGAGTSAYAVATAASPHSGSIPSAGPSSAQSASGGMGGGGGGMGGQRPSGAPGGTSSGTSSSTTGSANGSASTDSSTGSSTGSSTSGTDSSTDSSTSATTDSSTSSSTATASSASSVDELLQATNTTWAAAVIGDQSAASLQLSSGKAVMAIGGWSGSDAAPTLAQFKQYVAEGKIGYFVVSGGGMGGGQGGNSGVGSQITQWVEANYTATTAGGSTVYNLTAS